MPRQLRVRMRPRRAVHVRHRGRMSPPDIPSRHADDDGRSAVRLLSADPRRSFLLLERLTPVERAVFVLHEVLGLTFTRKAAGELGDRVQPMRTAALGRSWSDEELAFARGVAADPAHVRVQQRPTPPGPTTSPTPTIC